MNRWLLLLTLAGVLSYAMPQPLAAQTREVTPMVNRATALAYRLDREFGAIDGAQRHLLAWRLWSALSSGEFTPGAAVTETLLGWQQNLEQLQRSAPAQLPAWFAPVPGTVATDLTLALVADAEYAPWFESQRTAVGTRLARLLTSDTPPAWALVQYPQVLAWSRDHAPWIWSRLLEFLSQNPDWIPLLQPAVGHWTALPLDASAEQWKALQDEATRELRLLAGKINPQTDAMLELLEGEARLLGSEALLVERFSSTQLALAAYRIYGDQDLPTNIDLGLLALSRALAGVESGNYVQFIEVLSGLTEIALLQPATAQPQRLARVIEVLRSIDPIVLQQMALVDPGLQAIYLQVRQLLSDQAAVGSVASSLRLLASLRAALRMDTADLDGYRSQPVRAAIENDLLVCFDISRLSGPRPREPIALSQYKSCQNSFVRWAVENAASPELAGDPSGPFELANLVRELELSQWQRVNYWTGYLAANVSPECQASTRLVNPLEWALAANAYVAFALRWPAYAQIDGTTQIDQLAAGGEQLVAALSPLARCGEPATPLMQAVEQYAQALDQTVMDIAAATEAFRQSRLVDGADVRLNEAAWQVTNYRPENLQILPCGGTPKCSMEQPLAPSRALLGQLPSPFLVADQLRVGSLQLCYDNIQWVERRAVLPKVRNTTMARYFGRLSFELHTRLTGVELPVLSMRLTSDEEYEYLFGENTAAVLEDACPRDLIGTQVIAQMPDRRINLVPRRLTYMTADRADPVKILGAHWAQGKEWRDRFVTGEGTELLASQPAEVIVDAVDARLAQLFSEWNKFIYEQVLGEVETSTDLVSAMNRLDTARHLIATMIKLLAPRQAVEDPATRAALMGAHGLFDRSSARQLRQQGTPVNQIPTLALGHYEDARYLFSATRPERVVVDPLIAVTLARLAALRATVPTRQNQ